MKTGLSIGQVLVAPAGIQLRVEELLSSGGQGEVYRVSTLRGDYAVKWYFPPMATPGQREIIETMVARPLADSRFLWPQALVVDPLAGARSFGYLMGLRPKGFCDLPALFRREVKGMTIETLTAVALNTAEAFLSLHSKGSAYRDISYDNLFFSPVTGDILVCDNDNAVQEDMETGILGSSSFMAPELTRMDTGARPTVQTDLHSLAVLLFMLLMNHHPLEGRAYLDVRRLDEEAIRTLYGARPVFVYDPTDGSNRPVPGQQDTVIELWRACPPALKTLFIQAFTTGLAQPNQRVRETQWRDTLSEVYDAIIECDGCGRKNYSDPGADPEPVECRRCRRTIVLPPRLEITKDQGRLRVSRSIRLSPKVKLFPHHLDRYATRHGFGRPVGEVEAHPSDPGRIGLRNDTSGPWRVHNQATDTVQEVPPGRRVSLRPGLLIEFGFNVEGMVHWE